MLSLISSNTNTFQHQYFLICLSCIKMQTYNIQWLYVKGYNRFTVVSLPLSASLFLNMKMIYSYVFISYQFLTVTVCLYSPFSFLFPSLSTLSSLKGQTIAMFECYFLLIIDLCIVELFLNA